VNTANRANNYIDIKKIHTFRRGKGKEAGKLDVKAYPSRCLFFLPSMTSLDCRAPKFPKLRYASRKKKRN